MPKFNNLRKGDKIWRVDSYPFPCVQEYTVAGVTDHNVTTAPDHRGRHRIPNDEVYIDSESAWTACAKLLGAFVRRQQASLDKATNYYFAISHLDLPQ
jgi:hypothetical protein